MDATFDTTNAAAPGRDKFDRMLLVGVDAALAAVVFVVPLIMGGRHPLGELLYVGLTVFAAAAWCLRQSRLPRAAWNYCSIEWLLALGAALLILQIVPLPAGWPAKVSLLVGDMLPLWSSNSSQGLPAWPYISVTPQTTRTFLTIFVAHALLFLTLLQRLQTAADVERLLRWVAAAAVGMAALGLAQLLAGNGKFLWVYAYPHNTTNATLKGTFANQNHVGHYLALGIGPLIWWVAAVTAGQASRLPAQASNSSRNPAQQRNRASKARRSFSLSTATSPGADPRWVGVVALVLVVFAALSTYSRGAALMMLLAAATCVGLLVWQKALGRMSLAGLAAAAVVVIAALMIFGYQDLSKEMATVGSGSFEQLDSSSARRNLWAADLRGFMHSPIFGTGAGSHAEVYPTFYPTYSPFEFTYAESGYIQVLLETGVLGAAVVLSLIAAAIWWAARTLWRSPQRSYRLCAAAILPGLLVSAVHSIWDFVWYIPACLSTAIILAACGCRLWRLSFALVPQSTEVARRELGTATLPGFAWGAISVAIAGIGVVLLSTRLGPMLASPAWERYLNLRFAEDQSQSQATPSALMACLDQAIQQDPNNARARLQMAVLCLRRFDEEQQAAENPMPLAQLRDAAAASQFATPQLRQQWLAAALGKNRQWLDAARLHAQAALALSPLQGEAYTVLAELAFVQSPETSQADALVKQALRVRPYDADVLYVAGRDAALAGRLEEAVGFWKTAFHHDPRNRRQIIAILGPHVPAEQLVEQFTPDTDGSRELHQYYTQSQNAESAAVVARRLVAQIEQDLAAGRCASPQRVWKEASTLHQELGNAPAALHCIQQAVAIAPFDYPLRRDLAAKLLQSGQFDQAIVELRWCRQRQPEDEAIARLWTKAQDGKRAELREFESAAQPQGLPR